MVVVLDEEDEENLDVLNQPLSNSCASPNKATYPSWISYFETGQGKNNSNGLEAILLC